MSSDIFSSGSTLTNPVQGSLRALSPTVIFAAARRSASG
jgi:hypothetical protein